MQERPGCAPATFDIPYGSLWPSPVRYDGSLKVVPDGYPRLRHKDEFVLD